MISEAETAVAAIDPSGPRETVAAATDLAAQASERARAYLDGVFERLTADPERNAVEAELDRITEAEIGAGGGFRGSIDELIAAIDAPPGAPDDEVGVKIDALLQGRSFAPR